MLDRVSHSATFYDIGSSIRTALEQNLLNGVPNSGSQMPMIAIKTNDHIRMAQGHFRPLKVQMIRLRKTISVAS